MLNRIKFKNYKAFEIADIELKPITILLGTNSSGKSSILQSILLFEQTLNNEDRYESDLRLNGKYATLGEIANIFRNNNLKNKLSFSFEIDPRDDAYYLSNLRSIQKNVRDLIFRRYLDLVRYDEANNKILSMKVRRLPSVDVDKKTVLLVIKEIKRMQKTIPKSYQPDLFDENPSNVHIPNKLINFEIEDYKNADDLIDAVSNNLNLGSFEINYEFKHTSKENIEITKFSVVQNDKRIMEYRIQNKKGHKKHLLESDLFSQTKLAKYRVKFGRFCDFENLELMSKEEIGQELPFSRKRGNIFLETVIRIFRRYQIYLERAFDSERMSMLNKLCQIS